MNLCLSSQYSTPATYFFSSSISSQQGSPDATCAEGFAETPSSAAGTGYAQSKWVVEKLCQNAGKNVGLPVGVLRIGQMVGDSVQCVLKQPFSIIYSDHYQSGVWNETEGMSCFYHTLQLWLIQRLSLTSMALDVQECKHTTCSSFCR